MTPTEQRIQETGIVPRIRAAQSYLRHPHGMWYHFWSFTTTRPMVRLSMARHERRL